VDKVVNSAAEAVEDIQDGSSVAVGGFGLCGIPAELIEVLLHSGAGNLETISNNCGVDGWGLGILLEARRIRRTIASYVGENKEFGAGIPAFYTPAGVGTLVAEGGLPLRYDGAGGVALSSHPKEVREFDGVLYAMERAIRPDFALVHARYGDRHGNLVYEKSAQNFNPLCAAAGRITIAQVEELLEPGQLDPARVHTPGIFVNRVVYVSDVEKRVEKRTVRSDASRQHQPRQ
jgi:3-oxoacid CoA-transferase subunit A